MCSERQGDADSTSPAQKGKKSLYVVAGTRFHHRQRIQKLCVHREVAVAAHQRGYRTERVREVKLHRRIRVFECYPRGLVAGLRNESRRCGESAAFRIE